MGGLVKGAGGFVVGLGSAAGGRYVIKELYGDDLWYSPEKDAEKLIAHLSKSEYDSLALKAGGNIDFQYSLPNSDRLTLVKSRWKDPRRDMDLTDLAVDNWSGKDTLTIDGPGDRYVISLQRNEGKISSFSESSAPFHCIAPEVIFTDDKKARQYGRPLMRDLVARLNL